MLRGGPQDRLGHEVGGVLGLAVFLVRELEPLVDAVVGAALGLGRADRVLRVDGERAGLAVDDPLQRRDVVGADQVVALEELRVQRVVDEVRERLRVVRVGDVVEAQHCHVVVRIRVGVAGRRAVVGLRGAERVAMRLVELGHRGADARRLEVLVRALDCLRHLLRVVVEEAHVEYVLEGPRAPRGRRVVGRGVIVRDGHREVRPRDPGVARLEDLGGAPVEQVLGDVEVVLHDRDLLPVVSLDHERACFEPRLDPVGGVLARRVQARVDAVHSHERAVVRVLAGRGAHVPGGVHLCGARHQLTRRSGRAGDPGDQAECRGDDQQDERSGDSPHGFLPLGSDANG